MSLKLSDIEMLRVLEQSKTIQEASDILNVERTMIYRIMRKAENYVGLKKGVWDWKKNGVPPEISRIIRSIDENVLAEKQYPIVSIGQSLQLFLLLYSCQCHLPLARLKHLRSAKAIKALNEFSIDLAFGHRLETEVLEPNDGLSDVDILEWSAVLTSPKGLHGKDLTTLAWPTNSLADNLTRATGIDRYSAKPEENIYEPIRYGNILELIRRGYAAQVVIPDIFLAPYDYECLRVSNPPKKIKGSFYAKFRTPEYERISSWIDPKNWANVFGGNSRNS
jgi:hypothetical protein